MSATPSIDWYPSDWLGGTRTLSIEERAIYFDILMLIYESKGALSADPSRLARAIGTTRAKVAKALASLIEQGKLEVRGGFVFNEKAEKILQKIDEKSEKSRESAKARWSREKLKTIENQGTSDADAMPSHSERNANHLPPSTIQQIGGGGDTHTHARERILEAIGVDPISGLTGQGGRMLGTLAHMQDAQRWSELGLTIEEQVEVIREVMAAKRDGPPKSFNYFNDAMRRAAGQKAAPALTPITTPTPLETERISNGQRQPLNRREQKQATYLEGIGRAAGSI